MGRQETYRETLRMSAGRRERMMRVMDGDSRILPLLFEVQKYVKCDDILSWLIKSNITGVTLWDWYVNTHKASPLAMMGYVVNKIEQNRRFRQMYAGKDVIEE